MKMETIINEVLPIRITEIVTGSKVPRIEVNLTIDSLFNIAQQNYIALSVNNNVTRTAKACEADKLVDYCLQPNLSDLDLKVEVSFTEKRKQVMHIYQYPDFIMLIPTSTNNFPASFIVIDKISKITFLIVAELFGKSSAFAGVNSISKIYILSDRLYAAASICFINGILQAIYEQAYNSDMYCISEFCSIRSNTDSLKIISNINLPDCVDLLKNWGYPLGSMFFQVPKDFDCKYIWLLEPSLEHYNNSTDIKFSTLKFIQ